MRGAPPFLCLCCYLSRFLLDFRESVAVCIRYSFWSLISAGFSVIGVSRVLCTRLAHMSLSAHPNWYRLLSVVSST